MSAARTPLCSRPPNGAQGQGRRGRAHLDEDALPAVVDPAVAQGTRAAGVDLHAGPLDGKAPALCEGGTAGGPSAISYL